MSGAHGPRRARSHTRRRVPSPSRRPRRTRARRDACPGHPVEGGLSTRVDSPTCTRAPGRAGQVQAPFAASSPGCRSTLSRSGRTDCGDRPRSDRPRRVGASIVGGGNERRTGRVVHTTGGRRSMRNCAASSRAPSSPSRLTKCATTSSCRACPNASRYTASRSATLESVELSAEREGEDVALDLRPVFDGIDPVRDELPVGRSCSCMRARTRSPMRPRARQRRRAELQRHVLADRVAFVAVDAPFALLEVDRVVREVPVDDDVAVGVEVEALLPDRGADQDERPVRRVEPLAQLRRARGLSPCSRRRPPRRRSARERGVKPLAPAGDRVFDVVLGHGCASTREAAGRSPDHGVGDDAAASSGRLVLSRPRIPSAHARARRARPEGIRRCSGASPRASRLPRCRGASSAVPRAR